MKNNKNLVTLSQKEGGLIYSIVSVLPYLIMFVVVAVLIVADKEYSTKSYYTYITYLIPQIASLTALIYICMRKKTSVITLCSVKRTSPVYLGLGVVLIVGLLFGVGYFNELFVTFLESVGLGLTVPSVPNSSPVQFVLSLIIIGVLAPVLEELIFRGAILNSLNGLKTYQSLILGGVLFALFHQNPAQLLYQGIVGACLTYLALKSGSVLPSVVAHLFNNLFIIITNAYFSGVEFYNIYTIVVGLILFALSLLGIYFYSKKTAQNPPEQKRIFDIKGFYIGAIAGVLFNLTLIITTLFM